MKIQHIKILDAAKLVLRIIFKSTALNACIRKKIKHEINDLSFHFKKLGKEGLSKPNISLTG